VSSRLFSVFLCGDVMTGRGVDQILRHPGRPAIHERYVRDARRYVELAEWLNGPIPRAVDDTYIWGDALDELTRAAPQARNRPAKYTPGWVIRLGLATETRGRPRHAKRP